MQLSYLYTGSTIFLVLLLGVVVGVVFVCGLYVGSAFMQTHSIDFKPTFHILSHGGAATKRGIDVNAEVAAVAGSLRGAKENAAAMAGASKQQKENPVLDYIPDSRDKPIPPAIVSSSETKKVKAAAVDEDAPSRWPLPTEVSSGMAVTSDRFGELTSAMDELSLTVSAWIYLDRKGASNTMNTILANKASGCEVTPDRMGYALYVNTWETDDRQLILEWGNEHSGCAKLGRGQSGILIEYDTWTHVTAVLTSASVAIYINGQEVSLACYL